MQMHDFAAMASPTARVVDGADICHSTVVRVAGYFSCDHRVPCKASGTQKVRPSTGTYSNGANEAPSVGVTAHASTPSPCPSEGAPRHNIGP